MVIPAEFGIWFKSLELISVEQLGLLILNEMSVDIGVEQMCTCSSSLVATQLVDNGTDDVPDCSSPTQAMFLTGAANDTLHCNDDWAKTAVFNHGCMNVATKQ